MSRSFHVVPASDTLVLDPGGTGEVTYNVTNARTASTRVRVAVVPLRESQKEWYELADDAERLFSGGETVQVKVRVQVPASTPAGQFGFRLDALEADATDEPGVEGQSVGFEWAPPQGDGKKPFPWWIVAVAAGLLLLGGGVALFFALRSGGVELIALEGLPYSEARAWVEEQELVLAEVQELREEESDRVLAQEPEPGAVLEPGATVTLTRAMPWVDVVDLRGLRSTEAVAALQRQGLTVGKLTEVMGRPNEADTVREQEPAAGARVPSGKAVALTIEAPLRSVPNLVGRPWQEAVTQLGELGLLQQTEFRPRDPSKAGQVVSQDRRDGEVVQKGASLNLVAEPGRIPAPNVVTLPLEQARQAITQARLVADVAPAAVFPGATPGNVGLQDPPVGTPLMEGDRVRLVPAGKAVRVPDGLVGKPMDQARQALAQAGLEAVFRGELAQATEGTVLRHEPSARIDVLAGSQVVCYYATKKVTIHPEIFRVSEALRDTALYRAGGDAGPRRP